jgi:predicted DNA repair protein MutK
MPGGLVALLDDVASLTRVAAASLDDIGTAAAKAGVKAAGVVVDDTAVTPRYVVGLSPARELPIIAKIAIGSLRNKLLILLPVALLLSAFAPWAITPLLMIGGAFLCYEGAEKVLHAFGGGDHGEAVVEITDPAELETRQVAGAIRTDFILSAEIMAIALAEVASEPLGSRALILGVVAVAITAGVYGVVALIVKADDFGLWLAEKPGAALRAIGRGIVKGVPSLLSALSVIGTAAMIWVGGGILVHGAGVLGLHGPEQVIHHGAEAAGRLTRGFGAGFVGWLVTAAASGVIGLVIGAAIALVVTRIKAARGGTAAH